MSSAGSMVTKMPAKSAATSRIGWKVKRLALRRPGSVRAIREERRGRRSPPRARARAGTRPPRGRRARRTRFSLPATRRRPHLVEVALEVRRRLAGVRPPVPEDVDGEDERGGEEPRHEQPEGPGERHAQQVAQEERRVAERRQAAADVRDEEDEEDDGVGDVLALAVRLQQGTDEQHRGAGRADEGGEQRARAPRKRGVRPGVASRSPSRRMPPEITKSPPRSTMNET